MMKMKLGSILAFKVNGVECSISYLDCFDPGDITLVPIAEEAEWTPELPWTQ
jgi:hypothetical protein